MTGGASDAGLKTSFSSCEGVIEHPSCGVGSTKLSLEGGNGVGS